MRRVVYSKIIYNMTMNVDMSDLFTQMIMATPQDDVALKKLLYLYICTYAHTKQDLALLAVNTLVKDCSDPDPTIRGLALRHLCQLRIPNLMEYVVPAVKKGLADSDSYVRQNAVFGLLKVHKDDPAGFGADTSDILAQVETIFVSDTEPDVIINCVHVLKDIKGRDFYPTKQVVYALLNRLKNFNEWAQCFVLELILKYTPESEDEVFDIMNVLEDRLQHTNAAVVLAATKIFLNMTLNMPDIHQQVLDRIRPPLLTLMTKGSETTYVVLNHLKLLSKHAAMMFSGDYKSFYCRFSDTTYVKLLKIDVLVLLANPNTAYDIVSELCEYVSDTSRVVVQASVKAIGSIAISCSAANGIIERLLDFLDTGSEDVVSETVVAMGVVIRQYPDAAPLCLDAVSKLSQGAVTEPKARAAFVWIVGLFVGHLQEGPYILEEMVQSFEQESLETQLELLTAVVLSFCARAPESQAMLLSALDQGIASSHQDVRDRAFMYCRLMQCGVGVLKAMMATVTSNVLVEPASAGEEWDVKREFSRFNTLRMAGVGAGFGEDEDELLLDVQPGVAAPPPPVPQQAAAPQADLLGGLGGLSVADPTPPAPAPAAAAADPFDLLGQLEAAPAASAPAPAFSLSPAAAIDAGSFQTIWGQQVTSQTVACPLAPSATDTEAVKASLQQQNIFTLASGPSPGEAKLYCFAKDEGSDIFFLMELVFDYGTMGLTATVRTDKQGPGSDTGSDMVLSVLQSLLGAG